MKKNTIFIIILFSIFPLFSEVYWSGYYETEFDGYDFPQNNVLTNYHKFRLNMDTSPSRNVKIGGNIIYKHYEMDTEYNLMQMLPPEYRVLNIPAEQLGQQTVESEPQSYPIPQYAYSLNDTMFIDNLFLEFHHKYFDLTLGKQQLPIGVGYAWNPTDIFNKKDIFDPTYENRGHNALKVNIPIETNFTLSGIIQPESEFDEITQYYEIQAWLGRFDFSLSYSRNKYNVTSSTDLIAQFDSLQMQHVVNDDKTREIGGFSAEGELFGMGVRTEIAANRFGYDNNNIKYEYIAGLDYTFQKSLYILTEYHHNDLGARPENTDLIDYLRYFENEKKSINQNYLFGMVQYPVTDLIDLSFSGIGNLDDRSVVLNPEIIYRIYQDVELIIRGDYFAGDTKDEFGYQKWGGMIRLRAYF